MYMRARDSCQCYRQKSLEDKFQVSAFRVKLSLTGTIDTIDTIDAITFRIQAATVRGGRACGTREGLQRARKPTSLCEGGHRLFSKQYPWHVVILALSSASLHSSQLRSISAQRGGGRHAESEPIPPRLIQVTCSWFYHSTCSITPFEEGHGSGICCDWNLSSRTIESLRFGHFVFVEDFFVGSTRLPVRSV